MHKLIEQYLADVSIKLQPLPVNRRNAELREMRQHLQNAVIVSREFGQSEEEAAITAIAQFGSPEELAANHITAWQRGKKGERRRLLGATACVSISMALLPRLVLTMEQPHLTHIILSRQHTTLWITVIVLLWQLPPFLVAGAVSGLMFPRKAVAGTALAILVWNLAGISQQVVNAFLTAQPWRLTLIQVVMDMRGLFVNGGPYYFIAILGAWAASRWQQTRRGRTKVSA